MNILQNKYGGPKFNPHITVFGDVDSEPNQLGEIAKSSIEGIKPFKVKNAKIEFSDYIFKAAYISLELNSNLTQINQKLSEKLSVVNNYSFQPHVSLLYLVLSEVEQNKIQSKLDIKKEFTVNRIVVQEIAENVSDWKTASAPSNL